MNENRDDKMHSHNIDELFRSAIDPYEEPPSLEVWEQLEKDLDQYSIVQIKRKYDNFKKIAVALVLLLSSALVYELQTRQIVADKSETSNKVAVDASLKSNRNSEKKQVAGVTQMKSYQKAGAARKPVNTMLDVNNTLKADNANQPIDYFQQHFDLARNGKNSLGISPGSREKISINTNKGPKSYISSEDLSNGQEPLSTTSVFPSSLDRSPFRSSVFRTLKQYYEPIVVKDVDLSLVPPPVLPAGTSLSDGAIHVTTARKRSPFSLALIFSPDFTSRRIKEDWPINREDNKDEIRKSERYAFSYSFGALVDYKINRHWFVQSGFTLSRAVINIGPKFIFARPDVLGDMKYKFNSSSGYSFLTSKTVSRPAFGDSLHAFGSTSSLQYVSVPLAVKYKVGKKRLNVYGVAGAEANILVKDKIETSLGGNHENAVNRDIRGLKPVYYSALLAAGAEYNINKSLAVNFTPTARFALTSINKDAPVKSYQHSVGLVAGVQISF